MLSIKKDKTATISVPMEGDEWYIIDNPDLEYKINRGFPNVDFVFDKNDNIIDITYTAQPPLTSEEKIEKLEEQNQILESQNQMLTDCILEMSEIVYGGE